eukprot:1149051-Pelagomonas_calceolata.AAC.3
MANETTLPHSSRNLSSLPQFNLTFTFLNQKQPMSCACAVCACKVEDCDSEEKVVRWLLSYGALAFSSTMCGIYDSEGKRHSFTARQLGEHFKLKKTERAEEDEKEQMWRLYSFASKLYSQYKVRCRCVLKLQSKHVAYVQVFCNAEGDRVDDCESEEQVAEWLRSKGTRVYKGLHACTIYVPGNPMKETVSVQKLADRFGLQVRIGLGKANNFKLFMVGLYGCTANESLSKKTEEYKMETQNLPKRRLHEFASKLNRLYKVLSIGTMQ